MGGDGLSEKYQRLLQNLQKRGPLTVEELLERRLVARSTFFYLVKRGYLQVLDTLLGQAVVPGPRGRLMLGLTRFYRPRATAAADGLLLRRAVRLAEKEGWRFVNKNLRSRIAELRRNGTKMLVIASLSVYSARSLRNTLENMGWYERRKLGTAEKVRVYHRYPNRFRRMEEQGGGLLEVRPLGEILPSDKKGTSLP